METNNQNLSTTGSATKTSLSNSKMIWRQALEECPVRESNSVLQVVAMKGAQLSTMGTFEGVKVGLLAFGDVFTGIVDYLCLNWNNPKSKILELSTMAYNEYYFFSIAEIKHFSLKMKSGEYQSNKNLTPADLYRFLTDYANQVLFERAQQFGMQKPKKSRPVPDAKKVPEIEALLRENRQAYDKGLLTEPEYKHNYNVLIEERKYNLIPMVSDDQFSQVIKDFTNQLTQHRKEAEEAETLRLRQVADAQAAQLIAKAQLDKEHNIDDLTLAQRQANERNKKLNEMMYNLTGIKDFKLNANTTGDLPSPHQPEK